MLKKLLLATTALAALAVPAAAEDYYRWSGLYLGANAGYGWSGDDVVGIAASNGNAWADVGRLEPDGGFAGVQGGFNWQTGALVLGVESDIQWSGMSDSFGPTRFTLPAVLDASGSSDINWFGTIRGRVGVTTGPLLAYVTGGWAFADIDYRVSAVDAGGNNVTMRDDGARSGYVVGGGLEWAFAPSWSAKVEYQYLNFDSERIEAAVLNAAGVPNGVTTVTTESQDLHTVRIGLNYKFGAREEAYVPMK